MKRIFTLLLCAMGCMGCMAQNAPKMLNMQVEEFGYKKASAAKIAFNVLSAVTASSLNTSDKSMVPQINEAILAGASNKPWINVNGQAAADYRLRGTITAADLNQNKMTSFLIITHASIVDEKTGEVVASKVCKGYTYTYSVGEVPAVKAGAARQLEKSISRFIFEALPVTGSILERGVEQANGKVKDNQCYVDLGAMHGIGPDMRLYILQGDKYKGELKVNEVLGDDLCSCKIVKGGSLVSKCLENGTTLVVTSKPKKIKDE